MPPLPALIFDLDGTLVDTAPDLLGATNAVLTARGHAPIDGTSLRHMVGFGAQALINQALATGGGSTTADEMPALLDIFLDHYRAHITDSSQPFPGVVETLATLKSQGHRLGVLTNKPQDLTDLLLPRLKLDGFFAAAFGAGRRPYTKPDRRIFDDVVAALDGPDGRAVMIGDSVTDLQTARNAGASCILMSYGYTPVPVRELGADIVLDDFAQLPAALAKLSAG